MVKFGMTEIAKEKSCAAKPLRKMYMKIVCIFVHENKYYWQIYLDNCAYKIVNNK